MATAYYPEYLFFDESFKGAYSSFLHDPDMASFNEAGHHESYTDASAPDHIDDQNTLSYPLAFESYEQPDLGSSLLAFNGYGQHHHIGYGPIMAHYEQEHTSSSYYYPAARHVDMKTYDRRPLGLHIDTHSHAYLHAEATELVPPVLSPTQLGYPESASDPDDTSSEGSAEPHEYFSPDVQDISDMSHVSVELASPISTPDQLSASDNNLYEVLSRHPFFQLFNTLTNTFKVSRSISGDSRSSPFLSYLESLTQRAFEELKHDTSMHLYDNIIRTRILGILENLLEIINKPRARMYSQEDDEACAADAEVDYSSPTPSPTPEILGYPSIKEESDSDADDDDECQSGDSDVPRSPSPSPMLQKRLKRELPKDEDDEEDEDTESSSCEHPSKKRKTRENYDRKTTKVLMDWFLIHDGVSPNQKAKDELSKATGKTPAQIATWYQNARRRYQQKLQRFRQLHTHHPAMVYDFESFDAYVKGKESEPCRKRNKGKPDNKNA